MEVSLLLLNDSTLPSVSHIETFSLFEWHCPLWVASSDDLPCSFSPLLYQSAIIQAIIFFSPLFRQEM